MVKTGSQCVLTPGGAGVDDSAAILDAFAQCGHNGHIVFQNTTYHIERVMNTTGLSNCTIDIEGTLLWGTDLQYWLNASLPVGYQNQTSAWHLGGTNLQVRGFGTGTLDGNGQAWYDLTKGASNLAGRPHALTIRETKNSTFEGLRFVQSQMWTMAIINSEDVLLENIYVSSRSNSSYDAHNTDGADTIASNRITFRGWEVDNGDDSISLKANSTNILIENMILRGGLGIAIGSIGQYNGIYEYIENVVARNISCYATRYAGYIKTWTGIQKGYPPNGGGGGTGVVRNITFKDFHLHKVFQQPVQIDQCTSFNGATGGCDTSTLKISNITWGPMDGSIVYNVTGRLQCSAAAPCENMQFDRVSLTSVSKLPQEIRCSNVQSPIGFNCTRGL
ncbi:pectin lyase-like protein [Ceratobasidium sp. AG-I]|nr:pectin lyase-like protein [Ceratobasidium sp. AG-I]